MKQTAPSDNFPEQHGFTVPEGYFEQLPNRIMQRTAHVPVREQASWVWRFRTALAGAGMALAFAGAFFTTQYFDKEPSMLSPDAALAQVSQQDIYLYLLNHTQVETADVAEVPASSPTHELQYLEVKQGDVNEEAAIEELAGEYESTTE